MYPAFGSEDFPKLLSPRQSAPRRARLLYDNRDPGQAEWYRFHATLSRCAELMGLTSARPDTRRVRVALRNEHEKDQAGGSARPPSFSPRAAACNPAMETKGYAQHR